METNFTSWKLPIDFKIFDGSKNFKFKKNLNCGRKANSTTHNHFLKLNFGWLDPNKAKSASACILRNKYASSQGLWLAYCPEVAPYWRTIQRCGNSSYFITQVCNSYSLSPSLIRMSDFSRSDKKVDYQLNGKSICI